MLCIHFSHPQLSAPLRIPSSEDSLAQGHSLARRHTSNDRSRPGYNSLVTSPHVGTVVNSCLAFRTPCETEFPLRLHGGLASPPAGPASFSSFHRDWAPGHPPINLGTLIFLSDSAFWGTQSVTTESMFLLLLLLFFYCNKMHIT